MYQISIFIFVKLHAWMHSCIRPTAYVSQLTQASRKLSFIRRYTYRRLEVVVSNHFWWARTYKARSQRAANILVQMSKFYAVVGKMTGIFSLRLTRSTCASGVSCVRHPVQTGIIVAAKLDHLQSRELLANSYRRPTRWRFNEPAWFFHGRKCISLKLKTKNNIS